MHQVEAKSQISFMTRSCVFMILDGISGISGTSPKDQNIHSDTHIILTYLHISTEY